MTALIALVLALALTEILLPIFDRILGKPIAFHYLADWPLRLSTDRRRGFRRADRRSLSGARSFPASGPPWRCAPTAAKHSGSGMVRTILVVMQFAVSIGLGIAAMVVFQQISFARNVDLGFNKDGVVIINGNGRWRKALGTASFRALNANPGSSKVRRSQTMCRSATTQRTWRCSCRAHQPPRRYRYRARSVPNS